MYVFPLSFISTLAEHFDRHRLCDVSTLVNVAIATESGRFFTLQANTFKVNTARRLRKMPQIVARWSGATADEWAEVGGRGTKGSRGPLRRAEHLVKARNELKGLWYAGSENDELRPEVPLLPQSEEP